MNTQTRDPQDTCRPGDPDPTPLDMPVTSCCPLMFEDRLFCTRVLGHTGQHVAGNGEVVMAVWGP